MHLFFAVFGFIFVALFAIVANYIFDLFPYNKVTSFIAPKKEGIWNNITVTILPILVWSLIEMPIMGTKTLFILAVFLNIFVSCSVIYVIKYGSYILFQKENNIINIVAIFISSLIGNILVYMLFIISDERGNMLTNIIGILVFLIIYSYLTIRPPKIAFFGISKEETRQI